jgi:hypothetical protein
MHTAKLDYDRKTDSWFITITEQRGAANPAPVDSETSRVPEGFILFSDAVRLLCRGMFATLPRPEPVAELNKAIKYKAAFGPWTEEAAKSLADAAENGDLPVHALRDSTASGACGKAKIVAVPAAIVRNLLRSRGGLVDRQRVSLKTVNTDLRLFGALNAGVVVISEEEFAAWYQKERAKGRWKSQGRKLKKIGRPSKLNKHLEQKIRSILPTPGQKISIAELGRQLRSAGAPDVPSDDTLARMVDQIYRKTGDKKCRRIKRRRRQWSRGLPVTAKPRLRF